MNACEALRARIEALRQQYRTCVRSFEEGCRLSSEAGSVPKGPCPDPAALAQCAEGRAEELERLLKQANECGCPLE